MTLGQTAIDDATPADDDQTLWSVTTIIGALDKPALMYWAAGQTAIAALASLKSLPDRIEEDGYETTVEWLRDARFRKPKDRLMASALGTVFHAAAEEYGLTGIRPDHDWIAAKVNAEGGRWFKGTDHETAVVAAMLDQFDRWLQRFSPSYQATEVMVFDSRYGYAGTADAFLTVDGVRFLADYKTSREPLDGKGNPRTPYPEQVGLQLAAYRYAEGAAVWRPRRTTKFRRRYYLLSPAEREMAVPVPEVDTGLVMQVTPESCEAYPIRIDEEVHRAFLHTMEVFRWLHDTSDTVMGDPLEETTHDMV
jgi:hypothetical protein